MSTSGPARLWRYGSAWAGAALALVGVGLLGLGIARAGAGAEAAGALVLPAFGWGLFVQLLQALGTAGLGLQLSPPALGPAALPLAAGAVAWLLGCALVALGLQRVPAAAPAPSPAAGAPLYPRLARYRDFYWSTLAAYGGGILLAELVLVLLQTALAASGTGEGAEGRGALSMPPTGAFAVALVAGGLVAFLAGFTGASRAQRLSLPEATVGAVYLGMPLPLVLTLMERVPALQLALGYRLREVTYVAGLLGRPELGYWLVFVFLVLMLVLGMNTGFIAAGSGRVDVRMGFELFVARRHVSIFRPSLVLGTLAVLLLGILPPLVIYGILAATEAAVQRTHLKKLGLRDPLLAADLLHRLKLREQTPTAMMTALSVGGVGVGVMALIIVLSVMSGFEDDLQQKILGTNAHAVVTKWGSGDLPEYKDVMKRLEKTPGIAGQTPFILSQVMIAHEGEIDGVIIKGIDPATVGQVADLPRTVQPPEALELLGKPEGILRLVRPGPRWGDLSGPDTPPPTPPSGLEDDPIIGKLQKGEGAPKALPGILLGRELAARLHVVVGDRVSVVSPVGTELGPTGPQPKQGSFRVAGIFYTGMYEYDSKFVYILLEEAQRFFGVDGANGIDLKVTNVDDARRISRQVSAELGYPFRARDWGEMNKNLFSALRLEKLVMGLILSIIIVVATGLIVATVIMLVLEKRKEISVLKALGVPDGGIVKIFLAEGLQIGVVGGLTGLLAGLAWCFFIAKVGIKLDPEVYYIPALPVRIEPVQTALAPVIAVLVTYLASIYPALKASRVEPVEGLKAE